MRESIETSEPGSALVARGTQYASLLQLACVWGVVVILAVLLRGIVDTGGRSADFRLFYETVERARTGLPMYGPLVTDDRLWMPGPNYNPPHFYIFVALFAELPFGAAFVLWTAAGLGAGFLIAVWTVRALRVQLVAAGVLIAAGLLLANAALPSTLRAGQMSLFLTVPVSLGWMASRNDQWVRAGAWLGLAASIKPFLLIFAPYLVFRRRWGATLAMLASGVACLLTGALVFGVDAVQGWLATFDSPRMDPHFYNSSLAGFLTRTVGAEGIRPAQVLALVGIVLTVAAAARSADIDRAWLLLLAGSLLWSPLGWIYYGWILMPPLAALGVRQPLPRLVWGWVFLWLWPPYTPGLAAGRAAIAATLGSVYFWGLLLMWIGLIAWRPSGPRQASTPGTQHSGVS